MPNWPGFATTVTDVPANVDATPFAPGPPPPPTTYAAVPEGVTARWGSAAYSPPPPPLPVDTPPPVAWPPPPPPQHSAITALAVPSGALTVAGTGQFPLPDRYCT